jgi:hypothetical protein
MSKVPIQILKSYRLDSGDISGMFKIPAEKVTKSIRIALIELEGVLAEVSTDPETPQTAPADPLEKALRLAEGTVLALNELKDRGQEGGPPEKSPQTALNGFEGINSGLGQEKEATQDGFCNVYGVKCDDSNIENHWGEACEAPCTIKIARENEKGDPA